MRCAPTARDGEGMRTAAGGARRRAAANRNHLLHKTHNKNDKKTKATNPFSEELRATAKYIATRGKGILASDESNATTGE